MPRAVTMNSPEKIRGLPAGARIALLVMFMNVGSMHCTREARLENPCDAESTAGLALLSTACGGLAVDGSTGGSGDSGSGDSGSGSGDAGGTQQYTIGVSLSYLSGSGLTLLNNGGDALNPAADGSFNFATSVADGAAYNVTVGTQPTSPREYCHVISGSGTVSAANVTGVQVYCFQLPDSGQTQCTQDADARGSFSTCPQTVTGQDGDYVDTPAAYAPAFHDAGETVLEASSGLIWQRCTRGQTGTDCSGGSVSGATQATAVSYCDSLSLAGRTWRLPTARELLLMSDYQEQQPAANTTVFTNQPSTGNYWSSTASVPGGAGQYWYLQIDTGDLAYTSGASSFNVRCVSGPSMPASSFADNGDGTVTDAVTSLMWTKCAMNSPGAPHANTTTCAGSNDEDKFEVVIGGCEGMSYAGHTDWRLPSIRELATLVDFSANSAPYIDTTFFPNTGTSPTYAASTSEKQQNNRAWGIRFNTGTPTVHAKMGTDFASRCVRSTP